MEAGIAGETTRLAGYLNGDTHTQVTTTHEHHLLYAYTACVTKRILKTNIRRFIEFVKRQFRGISTAHPFVNHGVSALIEPARI